MSDLIVVLKKGDKTPFILECLPHEIDRGLYEFAYLKGMGFILGWNNEIRFKYLKEIKEILYGNGNYRKKSK